MVEERMRERKEEFLGVGMRLCVLFLIRGTISDAELVCACANENDYCEKPCYRSLMET